MIESEEPIPFAFYIGENEIAASVGETLREMVLVFLYFVIYRAKRRKEWLSSNTDHFLFIESIRSLAALTASLDIRKLFSMLVLVQTEQFWVLEEET